MPWRIGTVSEQRQKFLEEYQARSSEPGGIGEIARRSLVCDLKQAIVGRVQGDIAATAADDTQPTFHDSTLMLKIGRKLSAFKRLKLGKVFGRVFVRQA